VCTVADLGILSLKCSVPIVSNALTIASCWAWLLEHLLCSVYLDWCASLLRINIAIPSLTPLPSVKICMSCSSSCSVTNRVCWVKPVFRLYFVVDLVDLPVPHNVVQFGRFFRLYHDGC
jgi:hypothetical protein